MNEEIICDKQEQTKKNLKRKGFCCNLVEGNGHAIKTNWTTIIAKLIF